MSSVFEEAWEGLRDELIKHPEEKYHGIEIVGMMSVYLAKARNKAKKYLEVLNKEWAEEMEKGHKRWLEEQGD